MGKRGKEKGRKGGDPQHRAEPHTWPLGMRQLDDFHSNVDTVPPEPPPLNANVHAECRGACGSLRMCNRVRVQVQGHLGQGQAGARVRVILTPGCRTMCSDRCSNSLEFKGASGDKA